MEVHKTSKHSNGFAPVAYSDDELSLLLDVPVRQIRLARADAKRSGMDFERLVAALLREKPKRSTARPS